MQTATIHAPHESESAVDRSGDGANGAGGGDKQCGSVGAWGGDGTGTGRGRSGPQINTATEETALPHPVTAPLTCV